MNNELKGRILIVDDVEENLHYLARLLAMNGYQVRAVTSGQEGLVEARQYQPQLILLDILMPDMNGYTVCKRLKADARTADIPVIFVSVLEERFDKVQAFSYGAVDYLIKPFAAEEILARIETHLTLQGLQRTVQQESRQLQQAEFDLQESELRYRTLFEEAPVALWEENLSEVKAYLERLRRREEIEDLSAYLDQHPEVARHCLELARVVDVNQASLKLYGVDNKEAMLGRIDKIFSLESLEAFQQEVTAIARGDTRHTHQFTARHNITGAIFHFDLNWAVMPGSEQSYEKVLVCLIDITESKRMYEQTQKDARTKAILLKEVNHRVQNNLAGIIGMLYTTQNYVEEIGESPACQSIFAEVIQRIESLAAVHRILSESEWSPLSLEEMVRQIIQVALDILPPGKEVITEIRSAQPVYVTPKQANNLAMVINELITNTIKYTLLRRNQTHITIHIAATAETIRLEFGDDGPGFPAALTQGDLSSRQNLGIYLIRTLVQDGLRGEVKFWNRSGAVATIQFPVALL